SSKRGTPDKMGLNVGRITPGDRAKMNLGPDTKGVVIESIDPKSVLAGKQIRPGYVILEAKFGNKEKQSPVLSVENYKKRLEKIDKGDSVVLVIQVAPGKVDIIGFTL
ncbi:MAG: hypothetical protein KDD52_10135, partial [Bdellovibrionales bacterium]|nr:hypothetical protein [Bdellovibrionales bacterium]